MIFILLAPFIAGAFIVIGFLMLGVLFIAYKLGQLIKYLVTK